MAIIGDNNRYQMIAPTYNMFPQSMSPIVTPTFSTPTLSNQYISSQNVQATINGQAINQANSSNVNYNGGTPLNNQDNFFAKGTQEYQWNSFGENAKPYIPDLSAQLLSENPVNFPVRRAPGFTWNSSDNTPSNQNSNHQ